MFISIELVSGFPVFLFLTFLSHLTPMMKKKNITKYLTEKTPVIYSN